MADIERQQQRCPNPTCSSAKIGGRVLFETGRGGIVFKSGQGGELTTMGPVISAKCPACGHHWLNPDLVAFDGMAGIIERIMQDVAERAREQANENAERKPRDRLQQVA